MNQNKKHLFLFSALLLIGLVGVSGCQEKMQAPISPGFFLILEEELAQIPKIEEYVSLASADQTGFPVTINKSPSFVISDPETDPSYLVLRSVSNGETIQYSMTIEKNDNVRITIVDPQLIGAFCFVLEDPFSGTSPAWCFLISSQIDDDSEGDVAAQQTSYTATPDDQSFPTETTAPDLPSVTPKEEVPTPTIRPDYSFDLLFASDASGRFRVYKFNIETGESELQKNPEGIKAAYWATFCGDKVIAEVVLDGNAGQAIAILDPVKTNAYFYPVPLSIRQTGVPRCNPEGNLLAYSAQESSQWGLYVSNLETEETDRFYPPRNAASGYASWMLERNDFAFNVVDTSNANLIYILEDALSNPNYIKFGSGGNPSISPDGSQLVYSCKAPSVNERVLCIDSLHGSGKREELVIIYRKPAAGLDKNQIQPASMWSADGEWIYYASAEDGDWDIYRIHPNGTGRENLTNDWGDGESNEIYPAVRW